MFSILQFLFIVEYKLTPSIHDYVASNRILRMTDLEQEHYLEVPIGFKNWYINTRIKELT